MFYLILLFSISFVSIGSALNNGLARTPPMGWLSWARFYCETDCVKHPMSCINEQLYMDMADILVSDGYKDAGYVQVNIDDCWMSMERDSESRLQPNATRFPHGIKWLADYMHQRGLKLGIYEDYGTKTCGGYPGSLDYLKIDAQTFASWDVDMLKLDGCYADPKTMDKGYPEMWSYLNGTDRPIIYSCSWPDYIRDELHIQPNYTLVASYCNLWRNFDDISSTWASILSIIDYYDSAQDILVPAQGPGAWNDPDMLVIGNNGVSADQARVQMSIWSIYAAPLLMSNDLRFILPEFKSILLNKDVIAVDQDPLGIMGRMISNNTVKSGVSVYLKPITPVVTIGHNNFTSLAIVFFNRNSAYVTVTFKASDIGFVNPDGYAVTDLWSGEFVGDISPINSIQVGINATGVVMLHCKVLNQFPTEQRTQTNINTNVNVEEKKSTYVSNNFIMNALWRVASFLSVGQLFTV